MQAVPLPKASLEDYAPFVGFEIVASLRDSIAGLEESRVLHVSSTPYVGSVAGFLHTPVPLMCDVGLAADWFVLDRNFFKTIGA